MMEYTENEIDEKLHQGKYLEMQNFRMCLYH